MNYNDALKVINDKKRLGIMPGLARIMNILDYMGNSQEKLSIIHIAGTNGKGSVANMIANALMKSGKRVGLFTSPYVADYREQIQLNGEPIPEKVLADYINAYADFEATEFELLTAIMYKYFSDSDVDYAVVECGMGGLEDATNTESRNLSVIASVSLDHTDFLGGSIEEIARQKAGIIKDNSICVLYPNPETDYVFEKACKEKNAKLVRVSDCGDFRQNNLETANAVLRELGINETAEYPSLPARQERIGGVLLDGGHNAEAAKALAPLLENEVALIAMLKDKDVDEYLSNVAVKCKRIIATQVDNFRAMPADDLARIARKFCGDVISIDNPREALAYAKGQGLTLVCGSFYLAQEIRKDLL